MTDTDLITFLVTAFAVGLALGVFFEFGNTRR